MIENWHALLLPDVSLARHETAWTVLVANLSLEAELQVTSASCTSSDAVGTKVAVAPLALVASRTVSAGHKISGSTSSAAHALLVTGATCLVRPAIQECMDAHAGRLVEAP